MNRKYKMQKSFPTLVSILLLFFLLSSNFVVAQENTSKEYKSNDAKFMITFPDKFTENKKQGENAVIYTVAVIKGLTVYMVKYGINLDPLPTTKDTEFINKTKEIYLENSIVKSDKNITIGKRQGKQIMYISDKVGQKIYTYIRLFSKGHVWYTLMAYSNGKFPAEDEVMAFFDSFKFI